jgi:glyoxylase-like metal-dependent hydrolase (beta-lactamase superfamily II)
MFFRQLLHDERSCASYFIGCPSHRVCAVVDPQGDPDALIALAARHGLAISSVIDTHVHADHLSSASALALRSRAALHMHEETQARFPYAPVRDGDVIDVGNRKLKVLHTPGHTREHVCLCVDDWFLLTGDTLFVGDVGRVDLALQVADLPTLRQRAEELYVSLRRLLELPDHTEIYPGHFTGSSCGRQMDGKPVSTIGRERRMSRPLQLDRPAFVRFLHENIPPLPDGFHAIKQANLGIEPITANSR